jgi:hypothetical protein
MTASHPGPLFRFPDPTQQGTDVLCLLCDCWQVASVLSGKVSEVGEGFIVLGADIRSIVRLRGAEWVPEDIQVRH